MQFLKLERTDGNLFLFSEASFPLKLLEFPSTDKFMLSNTFSDEYIINVFTSKRTMKCTFSPDLH